MPGVDARVEHRDGDAPPVRLRVRGEQLRDAKVGGREERAVVRGLGIDRYPELKAEYFRNYTDLLYLAQFPDERLLGKAREIAEYLGLPLEVRPTGLGALETRLAELVEAVA